MISLALDALTMFWKLFWNGFATHFGSIKKHCQRFKTQWKCSSTHFQCVENALQRKNASTLFSLSLLFSKRVTFLPGMNRPKFLYSGKCLPRPKLKDVRESTLHWMQTDLHQFEPVIDCPIFFENVKIWFAGKLWNGRSYFPPGIRPVCQISREKS